MWQVPGLVMSSTNEVLGLYEATVARWQVTPSEFAAWEAVWTDTA